LRNQLRTNQFNDQNQLLLNKNKRKRRTRAGGIELKKPPVKEPRKPRNGLVRFEV
jgi:hypothetical protein